MPASKYQSDSRTTRGKDERLSQADPLHKHDKTPQARKFVGPLCTNLETNMDVHTHRYINERVKMIIPKSYFENCDSVTPLPMAAVEDTPPVTVLSKLSMNSAPLHF